MSDRYDRDDYDQRSGKKLQVEEWIALEQVKDEGSMILNHASQSLERYLLNMDDTQPINECRQLTRQLYDRLDRDGLTGAAFLAEEIDHLFGALAAQTLTHRDDALSTARLAIQKLSSHIEQIQAGSHTLPAAMFPLVNDLRSLQGRNLLSETPLFLPDFIDLVPLGGNGAGASVAPVQTETITKLRQMYQMALIGFFKDPTNTEHHQHLFQVFEQMEGVCTGLPVGDIWPVSHALLIAVTIGGVDNSVSVRNLLRQLDGVLGCLVNEGIEAFHVLPDGLLKNILFSVVYSQSDDDITKKVKQRYDLDVGSIVDPKVVITNIAETLAALRETLQNHDIGAVDTKRLRYIADALIVLGYPVLRKSLLLQINALSDIAAQFNKYQTVGNKNTLMNIISHLLSIEQELGRQLIVDADRHRESEMRLKTDSSVCEQNLESIDAFVHSYSARVSKAAQSLRGWNRYPHDRVVQDIHTTLLRLVDEARVLKLESCVHLAEPLAGVYQAVRQQQIPLSDVVLQVLVVAHEHLVEIMSRLGKRQPIAVSEELLERLQCLRAEMDDTLLVNTDDCRPVSDSLEAGYEADDELLAIFLNEAMDNLDGATEALNRWLADKDARLLAVLQRHLHTIKGGARMTGIAPIGDLAHGLEDLYEALGQRRLKVSSDLISLLMRGHDTLEDMLSAIRSHRPNVPAEKLCIEIGKVMEGASAAPVFVPFPVAEQDKDFQVSGEHRVEAPAAAYLNQKVRRRAKGDSDNLVQVSSILLDRMVDLTGETSSSFSVMEQRLNKSSHTLVEIDNTIHRLSQQLSRLDKEVYSDVNEDTECKQLSKALEESVTDLISLKDTLVKQNGISLTLLAQQINTHKEVQEGLIRTRMLPFDRMVPRLQRIVRKLARELDKPVELIVDRSEGEIDRALMEQIIPSLEHMLRNAIDHGIESTTAERLTRGKSKSGNIHISMVREDDNIYITLSDDGRGIHLDEIREKAKQRGLITDESDISDATAAALIFVPGISAAPCLTQISGRGVGMDVVKNTLENLGGKIDIRTESGQGTEFTIRLPCTVSLNRALMVAVANEQYAVPLAALSCVIRRPGSELLEQYRSVNPKIQYEQQSYDLYNLGHLLNQPASLPDNGKSQQSLLLLTVNDRHVALHVDAVLDSREIVVKSLNDPFLDVRGVSGAIALGDSRAVAILNLGALIHERPEGGAQAGHCPKRRGG